MLLQYLSNFVCNVTVKRVFGEGISSDYKRSVTKNGVTIDGVHL